VRQHPACSVATDFSRKQRAKSIAPEPNRFLADIDAALVQQILDVPQGHWKADVHHSSQTDDLRACLEVPERGMFCHLARLRNRTPPSQAKFF
jgi:hypothetical protein